MESQEDEDKDMKAYVKEILLGAKGGAMDEESIHAAVKLSIEVETLQAIVRLLQEGKICGHVDGEGEVVLRAIGVGRDADLWH
jgi:hypothetical protein